MSTNCRDLLTVPRQSDAVALLERLAASYPVLRAEMRACSGDASVAEWALLSSSAERRCTQALRAAGIPYDLCVHHQTRSEDGPRFFNEYFRPGGSAANTVHRVRTTEEGELFLALSDWDAVAARPGGPITREDVLAHLGVPPNPLAAWHRIHPSAS